MVGNGIAQVASQNGHREVVMVDTNRSILDHSMGFMSWVLCGVFIFR